MCTRYIDWLPLSHPYLGSWPTTEAFAQTGNQTSNLLVCKPSLNPLSHTSQGYMLDIMFFLHCLEISNKRAHGFNFALGPRDYVTSPKCIVGACEKGVYFLSRLVIGGGYCKVRWSREVSASCWVVKFSVQVTADQ